MVIADACGAADRIIVAGGGVMNGALLGALTRAAAVPVDRADDHGGSARFREAAAIGLLGALSADRFPITISSITGADDPPPGGAWCNVRPLAEGAP